MKKSALILLTIMLACWGEHWSQSGFSQTQDAVRLAKGVVFHDLNENRSHDSGEPLLSDIRVSNGREVVRTDEQGRYAIPVHDDCIIFVIKPSGWRTPRSEVHTPRFYYIHKPQGSPKLKFEGVEPTGPLPKSIDFPLYPQDEPKQFKALLFGDPQPRNQQEIDYIAHDVVEELVGTDASFGVTLGDILFDDLSLFSSSSQTVALLGIPWYNVIGNHDINLDASHDRYSDETFERHFGPSYYSFDYGSAHFIVLDNIEWTMDEATKKGKYRGGLGKAQLEFVRNDLAMIPHDQLVVLFMHVPIVDTSDRHGLYRLIEDRPFSLSVSGHTHHHEHRFVTKADGWQGAQPHHHVINVTVSGSWWSGSPDERGIPHTVMADGAPNGYSILSFDGNQYRLDFKAAGRPADYQMNIIAPELVSRSKVSETDIYANVFNGSERSEVQMRLGDGPWTTMKYRCVMPDPWFTALSEKENNTPGKQWRNLPKPKPSPHLWHARLPANTAVGTHLLHVQTTDRHGRQYHGRRVIRVTQ